MSVEATCQERAGFLFKHSCHRKPFYQCSTCHKQVCEEHTHRLDAANLCTSCARSKRSAPDAGKARHDWHDDPYFYSSYYYSNYGYYGRGQWLYGDDGHDPDDFTEADSESFADLDDDGFETDMEAS